MTAAMEIQFLHTLWNLKQQIYKQFFYRIALAFASWVPNPGSNYTNFYCDPSPVVRRQVGSLRPGQDLWGNGCRLFSFGSCSMNKFIYSSGRGDWQTIQWYRTKCIEHKHPIHHSYKSFARFSCFFAGQFLTFCCEGTVGFASTQIQSKNSKISEKS